MSSIFKKPLRLFVALFFVLLTTSAVFYTLESPTPAFAQEEPSVGVGRACELTDSCPVESEDQLEDNSCEANGGEFSFFLCPALRLFEEGVTLFDQEVRKAIQVNPDYYRESDAGSPLRDVWATLQNIAYILLIPVMLILVIGTALGFSFLDAYTVRRAMPRLLFAVVFITLSYDIGTLLIDISNAFSRGIQGLLVSAVNAPSDLSLTDIFSPPVGVDFPGAGLLDAGGLTGGLIVGGLIAFSVGALSIGIITSFLGTAALALLIVFLILMIRQLIIIMLLVLLPLAIVTWIFPGNDKFWKLTWSTFTGLLIAGPAYAAMTILGRIAAYIINLTTAGVNDGLLSSALILITKLLLVVGALVGGLIVIQRLAGAAGALTGMVNDRSKGFFDRNKNYRANKRKDLGEAAKQGRRFNNTPFIGKSKTMRKLSRASAYTANAKEGINDIGTLNPRTAYGRFRANMQDSLGNMEHDLSREFMEKDRNFASIAGDDTKLKAAKFTSRKEIEEALVSEAADVYGGPNNTAARDRAVQQILKAQTGASDETFQKARVKAMAATGTGYQEDQIIRDENGHIQYETDEDGNLKQDKKGQYIPQTETVFRSDQFLEDINHAYGADRNGAARAVGELKGVLAGSGQLAGNAGFGTLFGELNKVYEAQGTGANYEKVKAEASAAIRKDSAMSTGAYQASQIQKPSSARELARFHSGRIDNAAKNLQAAEQEELGLRAAEAAGHDIGDGLQRTAEKIARYNDELDAAAAAASQISETMSHSAPAGIADVFAQELMSRRVTGQTVAKPVMQETGQFDTSTGRAVLEPKMVGTGVAYPIGHPKAGQEVMRVQETAVNATVRDVISMREERAGTNPQNVGTVRGEGAGWSERKRSMPINPDIERLRRGE